MDKNLLKLEEYKTLRDEIKENLQHGRRVYLLGLTVMLAALGWIMQNVPSRLQKLYGLTTHSFLNEIIVSLAIVCLYIFGFIIVYIIVRYNENNLKKQNWIGAYLCVVFDTKGMAEDERGWHYWNRFFRGYLKDANYSKRFLGEDPVVYVIPLYVWFISIALLYWYKQFPAVFVNFNCCDFFRDIIVSVAVSIVLPMVCLRSIYCWLENKFKGITEERNQSVTEWLEAQEKYGDDKEREKIERREFGDDFYNKFSTKDNSTHKNK